MVFNCMRLDFLLLVMLKHIYPEPHSHKVVSLFAQVGTLGRLELGATQPQSALVLNAR
jgi:hypothetical protein